MHIFKLPDVGEGIHEAVIANWLVAIGDTVKLDQPIVEIETDKALVEIPSPVAGVIAEIPIAKGTTAQVGEVLVVIRTGDEPAGAAVTKTAQKTVQRAPAAAPGAPAPARTGIAGAGRRVLAAPAVRKRALEQGIDLNQVKGSAAAGRITMQDLEAFASAAEKIPAAPSAPEPAPAPVASQQADDSAAVREPLQGLRKRIAERMEQAWRIPHVTSFDRVAARRLVKLRKRLNQDLAPQRLTYLPFIIKAVVQALKEQPYFNASLDRERSEILVHRQYHIGIATAIPDGLVVPVLRHADRLDLLEINRELQRLGELARTRKLSPQELSASTFTITNYGSFGGLDGTPIINPPESAILGCGRIEEAAIAVKGKLKLRPVLPLALSFDHRLHDGAAASQFLNRLKNLLAEPGRLLLHLR